MRCKECKCGLRLSCDHHIQNHTNTPCLFQNQHFTAYLCRLMFSFFFIIFLKLLKTDFSLILYFSLHSAYLLPPACRSTPLLFRFQKRTGLQKNRQTGQNPIGGRVSRASKGVRDTPISAIRGPTKTPS